MNQKLNIHAILNQKLLLTELMSGKILQLTTESEINFYKETVGFYKMSDSHKDRVRKRDLINNAFKTNGYILISFFHDNGAEPVNIPLTSIKEDEIISLFSVIDRDLRWQLIKEVTTIRKKVELIAYREKEFIRKSNDIPIAFYSCFQSNRSKYRKYITDCNNVLDALRFRENSISYNHAEQILKYLRKIRFQ